MTVYAEIIPTPELGLRDQGRLWAYIKPHMTAMFDGTQCWQWFGPKRHTGYGKFNIEKRQLMAHRVVYEHLVGLVPRGLVLDHLCRRSWCVNPGHLEIVTQRTNVLRGEGKTAMLASQTHCKYGHPLSGENLYLSPGTGFRQCKICRNERARQHRARKAARS